MDGLEIELKDIVSALIVLVGGAAGLRAGFLWVVNWWKERSDDGIVRARELEDKKFERKGDYLQKEHLLLRELLDKAKEKEDELMRINSSIQDELRKVSEDRAAYKAKFEMIYSKLKSKIEDGR